MIKNEKFTKTHEWVREETAEEVVIGITHHAQELMGDVVFVELPRLGAEYQIGQEIAVIESVKAAADVYAPLPGVVVAVNTDLKDAPELLNKDPYGDGWLVKMKLTAEAKILMHSMADNQQYQLWLEGQEA